MAYRIEFTPVALEMLSKVTDRREQEGLLRRVEDLKEDPEKQGKPLVGKLKGYRSLRALGQRYRIIYRVNEGRVTVVVVGVGRRRERSRKDVYTLLERLLKEP